MEFFSIAKLFWFFAAPSHVLVWLLVAGAVLSGRRIGRILIAAVVALFGLLLFFSAGDWAVNQLENQYPRGPWPAHVNGVLELGGGLDVAILQSRGIPGAEYGEARTVGAFELARRYPAARILFSGGSGDPKGGTPETVAARYIFGQLGISPGRVVYENRSRDTWENLVFSQALAKPKPGEVWLLVTSAYHMPRAMAVARQVGWTMQPWPSDYVTMARSGSTYDLGGNLRHLDLAAHEWVGLLAYRFAGRAR